MLECGSPEAVDPLTAWQRTSWWVYAGLMSSAVDRERYWEVVSHALRKYFNQHSKVRAVYIVCTQTCHWWALLCDCQRTSARLRGG